MKTKSIWKKIMLLTFGSVLMLQTQIVRAQEDSNADVNSDQGTEECVITEDQL